MEGEICLVTPNGGELNANLTWALYESPATQYNILGGFEQHGKVQDLERIVGSTGTQDLEPLAWSGDPRAGPGP